MLSPWLLQVAGQSWIVVALRNEEDIAVGFLIFPAIDRSMHKNGVNCRLHCVCSVFVKPDLIVS